MPRLTVRDVRPPYPVVTRSDDATEIADLLSARGASLSVHPPRAGIDAATPHAEVLATWRDVVDAEARALGQDTVDVVGMAPDAPGGAALRAKFLDEHRHREDEVRLFVHGSGLFCLRFDDAVFEVTCGPGDLLRVPAGQRHWFDAGERPDFVAVRWLGQPEGWVAEPTGDGIAAAIAATPDEPTSAHPADERAP
jgi:1,2-dihydroxy-3-keto-5-methylthiopentene dioxygenase